jgi:putative oxidoreductase
MNPRVQSWLTDQGLFLIRAMLAAVFIYHGSQKLFGMFGGHGFSATVEMFGKMGIPLPWFGALLSASAEFFGGLALLVGFWVRVAALIMAFNMAVACAVVHAQHGFGAQGGGMEYPLTRGVVLFALVLIGPGRFCVDRLISFGRISAVQQSVAE